MTRTTETYFKISTKNFSGTNTIKVSQIKGFKKIFGTFYTRADRSLNAIN